MYPSFETTTMMGSSKGISSNTSPSAVVEALINKYTGGGITFVALIIVEFSMVEFAVVEFTIVKFVVVKFAIVFSVVKFDVEFSMVKFTIEFTMVKFVDEFAVDKFVIENAVVKLVIVKFVEEFIVEFVIGITVVTGIAWIYRRIIRTWTSGIKACWAEPSMVSTVRPVGGGVGGGVVGVVKVN